MDKFQLFEKPQLEKPHLENPYLKSLDVDHLYHLGLTTQDDLSKFSDVRLVCLGGTVSRMRRLAEYLRDLMEVKCELEDLIKDSDRYSMFKVGPILSVSHGMGGPSMSILLHELFKLLKYANAQSVKMIRIGTSGGVGVTAGTVVISTIAVNDFLEEFYTFQMLGREIKIPSRFDVHLSSQLTSAVREAFPDIPVVRGKTMSTMDFYEAQARLDGFFCEYRLTDKLEYLQFLKSREIKNIEMEASVFAAMCSRANIPAAEACVVLVDRMLADQVTGGKKLLKYWEDRLLKVVAAYICRAGLSPNQPRNMARING